MDTPAAPRLATMLLFAAALAVAGCLPDYTTPAGGAQGVGDPGTGPGGTGPGGTDDAGTAGNPGPGPAPTDDLGGAPAQDLAHSPSADLAPSAADSGVVCDNLQSTANLSSPTGHHNAGQECQGCHAPGGGAPTFYVGGTLYNAVTGGAAVAGATLNVTDAAGKKVKIISATNGNFWTSTALTYPLTLDASLCPATLPMSATVGSNGACNNCHNSTFRVHLP